MFSIISHLTTFHRNVVLGVIIMYLLESQPEEKTELLSIFLFDNSNNHHHHTNAIFQ